MRAVPIERKSAVLTPSSLACLSNIATINLTAGCANRCIYCYIHGYTSTPRDGTIHLYANTAIKLAQELQRKRRLPRAVYFSPSSDLFQPVPEVMDMALEVLGILFKWRVGVSFLTKGRIPPRHMNLLKDNASLVQAQIGLITLDEGVLGMFEPDAAPPRVRLDQARELVEAGIATTGRLDPILPGLTDDEVSLRNVCSGFAEAGITTLAASTLFLRPAITGSLRKNLCDASVRTALFDAFSKASRLPIRAGSSSITSLPREARQATFARLQSIAAEFGITVRICACKNSDISNGTCHIAGRLSNTTESPVQAKLLCHSLSFRETLVNRVAVDHWSSPEAKIALFRSLFRGREDVYPHRFESRTSGKSGYSPVCGNEWVQGICEKPRVKCAACGHQQFLPVTDDVIRWHLSGRDDRGADFVAGVYPMLLDETCFFLAIDFDKTDWQEDARAVLETCGRINLPAALERSRSGNGAHVWMFFEVAIPAALARRLGSHVLTETMEHRPDIGLDSYDRFFPNQDTLPRGGFGNLIALPLQQKPREVGNTVFVNEQFAPHADQWAFLSSVKRIARTTVEEIVCDAGQRGRIIGVRMAPEDEAAPWNTPPSRRKTEPTIAGPLPRRLELTLGDQIYIAKGDLPPGLRNRLLRIAAFQNPEFYKAQSMRLPTYGKPRIIGCAEDHSRHFALPRGCLEEVRTLLSDLRIEVEIRDERFTGAPLHVTFQGQLRPEQQTAAHKMLAHDIGVLSATTAFGKTVVAAWLIAERKVNTLVLVHRRQLVDQWVEQLSTFFGLPAKEIGRIGGGKKKANGLLDVATIQSLVRKGVVKDCVGDYGHVIVDECHHLSARSFELVARRAKAKYVTGLSATVTRKDGHHPIIFMQCGPMRYRSDAKVAAARRPFQHTVHVRPTSFRPVAEADPDRRMQFHNLYQELIADEDRNRIICDEVIQSVRKGRSPLVLTERKDHLKNLATRLESCIQHVVVLHGGTGLSETRAVADRLAGIPDEEDRVLVATGRYIGEGFDDSRLDTLFLTLPVSWQGTIAQYVGRLHRLHDGKTEVRVYDYADLNVPMLARMFDRRCAGYEAVGYTVLLPGSAVAGWPVEVPLPVDPQWKNEYAATVRRLVRDGVDAPLAKLFVHVARKVDPSSRGIDRARSATEAFFYRCLETLPETAGRFRLNAELPIPFDGWGKMEVDLLCKDIRLIIELDGGQHLADADAYRRDRRKDALLQEHGYFVLRFLAEDVGTRLDMVLETILRTLCHRGV